MNAACFHCALPASEGRWRAELLGAERAFCCAGCLAVAQAIVAGGAERYYETRSAPGVRPAESAAAPAGLAALDDPGALVLFARALPGGGQAAALVLEGVRCGACLWLIERALRAVPGVLEASLDFGARRAQVAWDPARVRLSAIVAAVRAVGYEAWPWDPRRADATERGERRAALWRLFVAGFGAMQVMMYAFPAYIDEGGGTLTAGDEQLMRWASLILTLPVLLFSCGPFFAGAWRELRALRPGMDLPIALGIAAGFAASAWATLRGEGAVYFDSIAMLVFLLLGARYLEMAARRRAARSLERLARWMPSAARRLRDPSDDASGEDVPAHALREGDAVLVPAGERVPADGVVLRGASSADESLLSGEPLPLAKRPGAPLVAGSVNLEQPLAMRVTRAGAATRAAGIARLVERASAARPRLMAAADRLALALTPLVLLTALAAGLYWRDPWIAIAVLVATCPCALALAAPVALTAATGRLLEEGAALTRASALETLERASDVVLDKTGTLTTARFVISGGSALGDADLAACLGLARALEASSAHPLARAFTRGTGENTAARVTAVQNHPGEGVEALHEGAPLRLGTARFCAALAGSVAPGLDAAPGSTAVYLAARGRWLAAWSLEDAVRPEARGVIEALGAAGLRVHLLSGDRPDAAGALARRLGLTYWSGGASPEQKADYVARLQRCRRTVVMVGDGLNDAPVLARADVSIAMGEGADAAQRQADLVLAPGRLQELPGAIALARRTMRIVRQNFAWAIGYNAVALPAAAAGWVGPWEAAVGMAASSFIVVLNAMRVSRRAEGSPWKASSSSSPSPSPSYS